MKHYYLSLLSIVLICKDVLSPRCSVVYIYIYIHISLLLFTSYHGDFFFKMAAFFVTRLPIRKLGRKNYQENKLRTV